jgi:hypothetical protein
VGVTAKFIFACGTKLIKYLATPVLVSGQGTASQSFALNTLYG